MRIHFGTGRGLISTDGFCRGVSDIAGQEQRGRAEQRRLGGRLDCIGRNARTAITDTPGCEHRCRRSCQDSLDVADAEPDNRHHRTIGCETTGKSTFDGCQSGHLVTVAGYLPNSGLGFDTGLGHFIGNRMADIQRSPLGVNRRGGWLLWRIVDWAAITAGWPSSRRLDGSTPGRATGGALGAAGTGERRRRRWTGWVGRSFGAARNFTQAISGRFGDLNWTSRKPVRTPLPSSPAAGCGFLVATKLTVQAPPGTKTAAPGTADMFFARLCR